ncbi:hypothetical protein L249_6219 [Ophiocordyceps polyrhachis-furcata BCC 54312]|uniref:Protein kinase domain-containing protein n=1 Tax=Ophiocordyceps polyrhachis-furcata BCC 54312 TaxID=1330021 RepID=A0A367L0Y5_9HYPO|nr:hypothetical protein L249_6219 [Ophiocordyceps polyrhachis-furcata BCC 54312]
MASSDQSRERSSFSSGIMASSSEPRITVDGCAAEAEGDHGASTPTRRFASPMRQHRRTASAHREIKETLDAHVDFTNDEADGQTYQQVNQYTITDEMGRGSFGSVHRAVDQFGKEFAVKEFSKSRLRKRAQSHLLRAGPHGLPRHVATHDGSLAPQLKGLRADERNDALFFIREEIAIMKKLDHPNLVQLIELLDDPEEDSLYMVLEMCNKGVVMNVGLDSGQSKPYNDETCRYWFRDLILGIEYLHSQGVIHRDIKPDNLLLSEDDVLKVSDFGVSEMFEKPGEMMTAKSAGSPAFLPPELCGAHREVSGTAADIWSMGVSLYCLKYGRLPFNRPSVLEIYEAIKEEDAKVPKDDEDANFVDLLHRILDKDPDSRITMAELRNHAWVTKDGTDPLLSAEENCAHQVEPPNELELNRAITRKMNHLLCVVKAIRKFKTQLAQIRQRARASEDGGGGGGGTEPSSPPSSAEPTTGREVIESIARRRRNLLIRVDGVQGEKNLGQGQYGDQPAERPRFLGIGTGASHYLTMEDDPTTKAEVDVVADSPTMVDYDIYERAYDDAVERQLRAAATTHPGRPTLYLNKFVQGAEHLTDVVKEAEHKIAHGVEHRVAKEAGDQLSKLDGLLVSKAGGTGQEIRHRLRHHLASKVGVLPEAEMRMSEE